MSQSDARTICFVNGSGEHKLDNTGPEGYSALKLLLEKSTYQTQTISLLQTPQVPKDCNVVVVAGPKRDYLPGALNALKAFVESGGRAIVNFDAVLNVPTGKLGDTPNLAELVSTWGITANHDVIPDLTGAAGPGGPSSAVAGSYGQHAVDRGMGGKPTVFPLARSLDVLAHFVHAGETIEVKSPAEVLFSSTEHSYSLTNLKLPINDSELASARKGAFVLGAAAPVGSGAGVTQGRVVVVGSSTWMENRTLSAHAANRDLALNVMMWLTQ